LPPRSSSSEDDRAVRLRLGLVVEGDRHLDAHHPAESEARAEGVLGEPDGRRVEAALRFADAGVDETLVLEPGATLPSAHRGVNVADPAHVSRMKAATASERRHDRRGAFYYNPREETRAMRGAIRWD